jgi:hypothetical protein
VAALPLPLDHRGTQRPAKPLCILDANLGGLQLFQAELDAFSCAGCLQGLQLLLLLLLDVLFAAAQVSPDPRAFGSGRQSQVESRGLDRAPHPRSLLSQGGLTATSL